MTEVRTFINQTGARAPIAMSCAAIVVLLFALATGWGKAAANDEGAAAHLWQLLIGLQLPLIAAFLATADWSGPRGVFKVLAVQAALLAIALAPVAILRL